MSPPAVCCFCGEIFGNNLDFVSHSEGCSGSACSFGVCDDGTEFVSNDYGEHSYSYPIITVGRRNCSSAPAAPIVSILTTAVKDIATEPHDFSQLLNTNNSKCSGLNKRWGGKIPECAFDKAPSKPSAIITSVAPDLDLPIECPGCNLFFASNDSFTSHLKQMHGKVAKAQRDAAKVAGVKSIKVPLSTFVERVRGHGKQSNRLTEDTDNEFLCAQCGILFHTPEECREHIKDFHIAPTEQSNRILASLDSDHPMPLDLSQFNECATFTEIQKDQSSCCEAQFDQAHLKPPEGVQLGDNTNDAILECLLCKSQFPSRSELFAHMSAEHKKRILYECSACSKMFSHRLALIRHLDVHKPEVPDAGNGGPTDNEKNKCPYCFKQFPFPFYLKRHLATHTGDKFFACDECQKEFRSQGSLVNHRRMHSGAEGWLCKECGSSFPYRSYLKRHEKSHLSGPMKCPYCAEDFLIRTDLEKHVSLYHKSSAISCPQCEKTFLFPSHLERHLASHTRAKDHECPLCGKSFGIRSTLVIHLNSHLPSNKAKPKSPYPCPICPKRYRYESHVQHHIRKAHPDYPITVVCATTKSSAVTKSNDYQIIDFDIDPSCASASIYQAL